MPSLESYAGVHTHTHTYTDSFKEILARICKLIDMPKIRKET